VNLVDLVLAALLLLPVAAALLCRLRPASTALGTVVTLGLSAICLLVLPVDREVGGGGLALAVSGFGKGTLWLSLLGVSLVVLAFNERPGADGTVAWSAHVFAVVAVAARSPLLLLGAVLVLALLLPRLEAGDRPRFGWSRTLCTGAALLTAGVGITMAPNPPLTDHASTALLILGLMLMVGAAPFSGGLRQWLVESRARLAVLAVTSILPALVAALVNNLGVISALHEGASAGIAVAAFGALTLLVGAIAQLAAPGWRGLAADGAIADLGLALVGVGSFDITGLQGASLALLVLALARPFLYLLDEIEMSGGWAWLGAGAALFAAAGLPPTVGFAARLLVLASAFRLHPMIAAAVVVGMVIEVFASARLLLRLGIPLSRPSRPAASLAVTMVSAAVTLLCLAAGLAPKALLTYVWSLG
jgi:hypothetical protein